MIERSGTSDSPHTLMVRAAAEVLRDWGHTRDDAPDDLDTAPFMAATAAAIRVAPDYARWEFVTENRHADKLFEGLAKSLEGDDFPLASVMCDGACEQAEYIIAEALQSLPTQDEIERDRHLEQQIDEYKEATHGA